MKRAFWIQKVQWGHLEQQNNGFAVPFQCTSLPTKTPGPNDHDVGVRTPWAGQQKQWKKCHLQKKDWPILNQSTGVVKESNELAIQKQMFCSRWYKGTRKKIFDLETLFSLETCPVEQKHIPDQVHISFSIWGIPTVSSGATACDILRIQRPMRLLAYGCCLLLKKKTPLEDCCIWSYMWSVIHRLTEERCINSDLYLPSKDSKAFSLKVQMTSF